MIQGRKTEITDGIGIVTELGELDFCQLEKAKPVWQAILNDGRNLILDCSQIQFIDCASIGGIIESTCLAKQRGLALGLIPSNNLRRLMGILGEYTSVLLVFSSVKEAMESPLLQKH